MEKFEHYILQNPLKVDSYHPHFNEALNTMVQAGGKRFRPALLLAVVQEYAPLLYDGALPVAYGLELFHTYSLIHDDLPSMDDAALRRGKPTLHVAYDEVTATLAGDALNTEAFHLVAKAPLSDSVKIKLIQILGKEGGIGGMIIGQALDCHFENTKLRVDEVKFLHIHKTAKLIAASLQMGAVICDLDTQVQQRLYDLGIKLGLLFQIQDDIIDETQSSEDAGKTTGNDGDKNSFVNLIGLDESYGEADRLAQSITEAVESFDPKMQNALEGVVTKYINRHKG